MTKSFVISTHPRPVDHNTSRNVFAMQPVANCEAVISLLCTFMPLNLRFCSEACNAKKDSYQIKLRL
jgi:hypothetical protein